MQTPTEFYTTLRLFPATKMHPADWGNLGDGFDSRDEAIERIINGFDADDDAIGMGPTLATVKVVKIDLTEGTARDVTEDVLREIGALVASRLAERGWAAE